MLRQLLRPRKSRRPQLAGVVAAHLAWFVLGAGLAWAAVHTRLESSVPAADQVLSRAPERFELRFSGPVNASLSSLVLVTPAGDSIRVTLATEAADDRTLVGRVPELVNGAHLVIWRTVSADGHPVSGEFGFTLAREPAAARVADGADAEPTAAGQGAPPGETAPAGTTEPTSEPGPPPGTVLLAGLGMACLLGFAGLLWYCGALPLLREPRIRSVTGLLGWASLCILTASYLVWIASVLPPGSRLAGLAAATGSSTGIIGLARLGLIGLALAVLPRHGRAASALALAAVVVGAMSGHTAAISPWATVPANAIHLGAGEFAGQIYSMWDLSCGPCPAPPCFPSCLLRLQGSSSRQGSWVRSPRISALLTAAASSQKAPG